MVASADLSGSTNISGFAERYGDFPGYGWYERFGTADGVLLPQEITEFANAGMLIGMTTVNFAADPEQRFDGFWGACSTYGSFSYLKYGPMRLFSQLAQDCELKTGKMIWVAGHSGPETAEDSRTHFGIYSPGVTQLFPDGAIINLHPWEYNEVPVLLGAALREKAPIVALHLTRPPVTIPDRAALGIPSHFEAARGAYVLRDHRPGPRGGTVIVQGASTVANIIAALPELDARGLNVKIVCATSPQLFALQTEAYRRSVLAPADYADSTVITTQARWLMHDWLFNKVAEAYALSADWDDRWRTGGAVDEVLDEAHLTPEWIVKGIERFVNERPARLACLRDELDAASGSTTSATTRPTSTFAPGASAANRAAFAKWGAWVNAFGAQEYGRPPLPGCLGRPLRLNQHQRFRRALRRLPWLRLVRALRHRRRRAAAAGDHRVHELRASASGSLR